TRRLRADDFYTTDGIHNTVKRPDEIVTRVRVPFAEGRASAFEKLRRRGAIDYPLLNAAVRLDLDGGVIRGIDVVVSALAARPKRVKAAERAALGSAPTPALFARLGEAAYKQCRPLTNIDNDPAWRHEMVRVIVERALTR